VRQAVLARDALQWTIQWDPGGCRVETGSWIDPYGAENPVVTDPKALDVDHLIPLGYAHAHGGAAWSKEKKAEYANALGYRWHLWAVSLHANRQKGDKGPAAWVPENLAIWCQYGQAWATIAVVWKLELPDTDREAVRKLVETC
jgi:5-methylcytosine-specific restriction endonuclease McrA